MRCITASAAFSSYAAVCSETMNFSLSFASTYEATEPSKAEGLLLLTPHDLAEVLSEVDQVVIRSGCQ